MVAEKKVFLFMLLSVLVMLAISSCFGRSEGLDFILKQPEKSKELSYSDVYVDFSFRFTSFGIELTLLNKSSGEIRIDWNKVLYGSPFGEREGILNEAIIEEMGLYKYLDGNIPSMTPTTVLPGTKIYDTLSPRSTRFVGESRKKVNKKAVMTKQWRVKPMFAAHQDKTYHSIEEYFGRNVILYIPLEIMGTVHKYTFVFEIIPGSGN